MDQLKVELRRLSTADRAMTILINGRQPLQEGPRRIGHCCYCAGPCTMTTKTCEARVFHESWKGKR